MKKVMTPTMELVYEILQREEKPVGKDYLSERLSMNERQVRNVLSNIAMQHALISYSTNKGYKVLKGYGNLNEAQAKKELDEINHALSELQSRIKKIKKRMRPLIAYKKSLEQNFFNF